MKNTDFRILGLIALVFILASCGVDWFPASKRAPTTPDPFSFSTRFGVPIAQQYSSASVKISGFANNSTASPISISTGSTYSINGAAPVSLAGTIKNNDTVKLFQTSASQPGNSTVSTLTIGDRIGTFTTVTQTIATPGFTLFNASTNEIISSTISANDVGGHVISVSSGAQFAVRDTNRNITVNFTSGPLSVTFLNNQFISLLIPNSTVIPTTTLTVDNTNFVVENASPYTVTAFPK